MAYIAVDCALEILDGEEEGDDEEETEYCRDTDGHEYSKGSIPGCVVGFFGQMGGGVIAGDGILSHQNTTYGYIGWRGTRTPSRIARPIVECCKDEFS